MSGLRPHIIINATFILLGLTPTTLAQDAEQDSYDVSYFAQFQPNTAEDMVDQIPGFTLKGGGGGGDRGFGQASLNILINGLRPSSKTSSADEILGRIPANKVIRIDVKDGASLDIPGLSGQVADIITGGTGLSGSWEYAMRFWEGTDPQIQDGSISLSGERGALSYVASFNSGEFKVTEDGIETFADSSGEIFEDRQEELFFRATRPSFDLNLTYAPTNGHIANFNGSLIYNNRNQGVDENFQAVSSRGNTGQSVFTNGEDELEYEVGGDYAFPVANGNLKLIGLHRLEDSKNDSRFSLFNINEPPDIQFVDRDTEEGEFIGRAEYGFKTSASHDFQISAEGAFNYLDRDEVFEVNGILDTPTNVRVEERRAEGNVTHSWSISPKFDLQTSLGAEYSELSVPTVDEPSRNFVRPKGFITASYTPNKTYTWRTKLEREVGQLDFGLFTSGFNLTDDTTSSGNSLIVPTQSWNAELELTRQDSDFISGTLRAFINFIEDPIDRIRFTDGSEGPGNLDNALEYGIEGNATWLMSSIGLDGMRLELSGVLRESEIDDPVTLLSRRINQTEIWEWEVDFRYDVPNKPYALGFGFERDRDSPFFRLDESTFARVDRPGSSAFIEHKSIFGITARVVVQGLLDEKILRTRNLFDPDRTGSLVEIQNFERQRGRRISFEISDTF